jgi:hypothetical protein
MSYRRGMKPKVWSAGNEAVFLKPYTDAWDELRRLMHELDCAKDPHEHVRLQKKLTKAAAKARRAAERWQKYVATSRTIPQPENACPRCSVGDPCDVCPARGRRANEVSSV